MRAGTILSRWLIGSVMLLLTQTASAEVDWASIIWHNDLFAGRDGGGYTNGFYISWYDLANEGEDKLEAPLLTLPLAWMQDDRSPLAYSAHTLGQAMFTPEDIGKRIPDADDAPYAGLLFFRSSYIVIQSNFADAVSTTIGVVGPASGAEKTQHFMHKVIGAKEPQGWDTQIGNEPVVQLSRTGVWRFSYWERSLFDAVIIATGSAGNLESSVGTGLVLRAGSGLDKSFSTVALLAGRTNHPIAVDGGWCLYAGATANYVFNQIFIDGNNFQNSSSTDLKRQQYALLGGVSYAWDDLSLTLSYQDLGPLDTEHKGRQEFGAVTIAWRL